jgi:predicted nucleic acid-binding Zn ribbon protein
MTCGMCAEDFDPAVHNQRYCSTRCKRDAENEARRLRRAGIEWVDDAAALAAKPKAAAPPFGPRILIIDIEVAPALAEVWGLWDQRIGLNQIMRDPYMLCFAAKWYGDPRLMYFSTHHDGREAMVTAARDLMTEADVLVHYNGAQYDVPHLKREIALAGLTPPSPFKQIDLYRVAKREFRWISNKLQYVSTQLGLGGKAETGGHELWTQCVAGDPSAWSTMRKYNKQDVVLTEQVYSKLLPWIAKPSPCRPVGFGGRHLSQVWFRQLSAAWHCHYVCVYLRSSAVSGLRRMVQRDNG